MNQDTATRLNEVIGIAKAARATKVKIDGIEIELDASAFPPLPETAPAPVGEFGPVPVTEEMCPCGEAKSDHNPTTGCAAGCPEWKCAGLTADGQTVMAGQYG